MPSRTLSLWASPSVPPLIAEHVPGQSPCPMRLLQETMALLGPMGLRSQGGLPELVWRCPPHRLTVQGRDGSLEGEQLQPDAFSQCP